MMITNDGRPQNEAQIQKNSNTFHTSSPLFTRLSYDKRVESLLLPRTYSGITAGASRRPDRGSHLGRKFCKWRFAWLGSAVEALWQPFPLLIEQLQDVRTISGDAHRDAARSPHPESQLLIKSPKYR
jgi:hypothetical protein